LNFKVFLDREKVYRREPGLMTFSGRMTKNNADVQSTVAPIISRRKPNHSFAAAL
jgi:hypothetical protein